MDGVVSSTQSIVSGVPQGSVIGPTLFSLYVNDFPSFLLYSEALMYADDTALIFVGDSLSDIEGNINEELQRVHLWFRRNHLNINTAKTKYMVFHSRRKQLDYARFNLFLDNARLQQVASFKYLGVMFDSDMNWKSHIEKTCSKLAFGCHTLLKARECFGATILRILYFAFVHSHLSYCVASWGSSYKTHLKSISRLQKRALRIITFSNRADSAKQLFQLMRVLPLDSVHVSSVAEVVHRIIKHEDPFPLSIFTLPARCTRAAASNCCNLPVARNVYGRRLIEFNGALIWNAIPTDVKQAKNFPGAMKRFMLNF